MPIGKAPASTGVEIYVRHQSKWTGVIAYLVLIAGDKLRSQNCRESLKHIDN